MNKLLSEDRIRALRDWCQPRPNMVQGVKQPPDSWKALTDICDELLAARTELRVVAEAIWQNVSSEEMRHWAQGIRVTIQADETPKFACAADAVETAAIDNHDAFEMANARLTAIKEIIDSIESRCMAVDGPVTNTRVEMTDEELQRIYRLAGGVIRS